MPDDKTKSDYRDRDRINVHEDNELRYWTKELGVTPELVDRLGFSRARWVERQGRFEISPRPHAGFWLPADSIRRGVMIHSGRRFLMSHFCWHDERATEAFLTILSAGV